jgi:hypothetical protein
MLAVPALALIVIAEFFPDQVLRLVFSARYLGAEAAFAPLALAMTALSVTVVLTMYLLAHGRHWVVVFLGVGATSATLSINAAHGSPVGTARADLVVQFILMVTCGAGLVIAHLRAHGIEPPSLLERDLPE